MYKSLELQTQARRFANSFSATNRWALIKISVHLCPKDLRHFSLVSLHTLLGHFGHGVHVSWSSLRTLATEVLV